MLRLRCGNAEITRAEVALCKLFVPAGNGLGWPTVSDDDLRRQRRKQFWDQRVGYAGTRRGCLILIVVALLFIGLYLFVRYWGPGTFD
jgi:hypothetical protein